MNMLRTKNGLAAGELGTYELFNGGRVNVLVLALERDGDEKRVRVRVTSPTRHGYTRGEIINLRDTTFLSRRPRADEPPNNIVVDALGSAGPVTDLVGPVLIRSWQHARRIAREEHERTHEPVTITRISNSGHLSHALTIDRIR